MENQAVEKRDISEYQKLFEYEMTEVLLALGDELSAITTPVSDNLADAIQSPAVEIRKFPSIPSVSVTESPVSPPTAPTISARGIPKVSGNAKGGIPASIPALKVPGTYAIPAVAARNKAPSPPTAPTISARGIPKVIGAYVIPAILAKKGKVSLPTALPKKREIPTLKRTTTPGIQTPDTESLMKRILEESHLLTGSLLYGK